MKIKINSKKQIRNHEDGVALLIGLMLLLILTIIGLSAIRGTVQQEKMSAAVKQSTLDFQAAEAPIRLYMAEFGGRTGLSDVPSTGPLGQALMTTAINNGLSAPIASRPVRITTTGVPSGITASATIVATGTEPVDKGSFNKFIQYDFNLDSTARQAATGANEAHQQGIGYAAPKPD